MHHMPAQDFDHFDFGIARPTYHSGWGGPYGDGDYPGRIDGIWDRLIGEAVRREWN